MWGKVASAVASFIIQLVVQIIRERSRTSELERLGYDKAQVEASKRNNDRRAAAAAVRDAIGRNPDLSQRVRKHFERKPEAGSGN